MAMAYLSTRFFISREIESGERAPAESPDTLRGRVRQVISVALAHSFGIAMLFAIIFSSTAVEGLKKSEAAAKAPPHQTEVHEATNSSPFFVFFDDLYSHVDAVNPPHEYPTFLGVLPRDAAFDIGWIITPRNRMLPPGLVPHLRFVFYPTIVLTWTALGLFVGVFLEGFVKGERLRRPVKEEED